jgi:iron complex outermembrane recepter protein
MKTKTLKTILTILLLILFTFSYGQNLTEGIAEGIVKDKNNKPLELANILLKGTKYNTLSDANGQFSIDTREKLPFTLIIQFVGHQTAEIQFTEFPKSNIEIILISENQLKDVVITSRRRIEKAQNVPISVSVVGGRQAEQAGAFNVNRLKELIPSIQLYSSNPRNTTINIRGLGSTFGLTNDGIDPGVGFYVDGVYYARPAATTLDFVDIDQIEVLCGPQGTLFGKNTTAGAFNITSRKPSFTSGANFEISYGNFGFVQAKASITGALSKKIAGRLSFSGTQRDGLLENVATGKKVNDLNNQGVRGQLLFTPSDNTDITLAVDYSKQRPDGYAQVIVGVVKTNRADYRQFDNIIASLGYSLPSKNPFDRKIDHDTPWRSGQDLGGASLNINSKIGNGKLTATSAWRFWNWDPSNDRDFTGLPVLRLSQATSKHQQWSQEIRYAGSFTSKITGVVGVFAIGQDLKTDPYHVEESGAAQWRFSKDSTSPLWETLGLFNGYGIKTKSTLNTFSGAVFGQLDWEITENLHFLTGLRYNYDKKKIDYNRTTYGGLQTTDAALLALKKKVYSDQAFKVDVDDTNFSGNITLSYKVSDKINTFGTFANSYKPVGINLGGIPSDANGPIIELAKIKPEEVNHFEVGVKTSPFNNTTINLTIFNTDINNYQTLVQSEDPTLNRGYLANAEKVRVQGVELDSRVTVNKYLSFNAAVTYTDGKYISFTNAPLPLEETGLKADGVSIYSKDVSGGQLPGISKWAGTLGGDLSKEGQFFGNKGRFFLAIDSYSRSSFSSSATPSKYLNINGYSLLNGRIGFRASEGLSVYLWGRNLLDKNYFEQLLPASGNAGHYAGVLGDQRTYGITLRYNL